MVYGNGARHQPGSDISHAKGDGSNYLRADLQYNLVVVVKEPWEGHDVVQSRWNHACWPWLTPCAVTRGQEQLSEVPQSRASPYRERALLRPETLVS